MKFERCLSLENQKRITRVQEKC